jgi:hypothetical protein
LLIVQHLAVDLMADAGNPDRRMDRGITNRPAVSSAADEHTASSGDRHDGEFQPYRLPSIYSISAPMTRLNRSP